MNVSTIRAALAAALTVALISACGATTAPHNNTHPPTSESSVTGHNAQDVTFAQGMVPHHEQAIEMADLVPSRSASPEMKALAERVKAAQAPEITQLKSWLTEWKAQPMSGHAAHGDGMMTDQDLTALRSATGPDFDRSWLTMMIKHHEGAITMAKAELSAGTAPAAKSMAQRIVDSQQSEITEMQALLG